MIIMDNDDYNRCKKLNYNDDNNDDGIKSNDNYTFWNMLFMILRMHIDSRKLAYFGSEIMPVSYSV